ncbi:putative Galactoside 2-alpha-L-fucosyltransferase 1 [Hypsibius exemplaris]|uniref:L-Fucosyltransferase n=1 Tax=Hypsibius exemplaris TaxID=2072580 RepID=A0A1W0WDN1_HYPEX|nr:putative Galactoside 2-alpha-L-fucosyltransferase 1 [Hypsibius exemplaris]
MFGGRILLASRRFLVVALAVVCLLSVTGRKLGQSDLSNGSKGFTTSKESYSLSLRKYSACGLILKGTTDIVNRLSERIRCRLDRHAALSTVESKSSSTSPPMFLVTHDFFNAVGLGNFMFMAAALLGLADASGRKAFFFVNHHHMAVFQTKFPMEESLPKAGRPTIPEQVLTQNVLEVPAAGIYDSAVLETLDNRNKKGPKEDVYPIMTLRGYFQSWKYFRSNPALIRQQFTFTPAVFQTALGTVETALRTYTESTGTIPESIIGIHVRRGDILRPVMKKYGHTVASPSYLTNLVHNLTELYQPAVFLVLSNDPVYCKRVLGKRKNVLFIDGNPAEVDMAILSLMDHLILTVGTFGWWGAFLSDAQDVYYYKNWPTYGSTLDKEYRRKDYFLPNWKPTE